MQWAISIGRFDLSSSVMTLSCFCAMPRHGHMERVKHIYGYLSKMRDSVIRIRTDKPDRSGLPDQVFDWSNSAYGEVKEIIDDNMPLPLGKPVTVGHYFDANLYHDLITGRSVTGILHLFKKTPIEWYSKKQANVETATFGSELIAAHS
jgi:hypothetical protein